MQPIVCNMRRRCARAKYAAAEQLSNSSLPRPVLTPLLQIIRGGMFTVTIFCNFLHQRSHQRKRVIAILPRVQRGLWQRAEIGRRVPEIVPDSDVRGRWQATFQALAVSVQRKFVSDESMIGRSATVKSEYCVAI